MKSRLLKTVVAAVLALAAVDVASSFALPGIFDDRHFDDSVDGVNGNLRNRNNVLLRVDRDFPSRRDPAEYVIGVFGGSVADSLASRAAELLPSVRSAGLLAQKTGKRLRIVDFALGGGSEPAQLNMLHLFHGEIDVAVFLDGYNELKDASDVDPATRAAAIAALWDGSAGEPPRFPEQLIETRRRLLRLTGDLVWPVLRHSGLVRSYVYNQSRDLTAATNQFFETLDRTAPSRSQSNLPSAGGIELWQHGIELSDAFGRAAGIPVYFFLQPSQYVHGSKRFTDEEKACCFNRKDQDEEWGFSEHLDESVSEMSRRVGSLRQRGIAAVDLTPMFKDVASTVYADRCCHLNRDGETMLAEAIFDALLAASP